MTTLQQIIETARTLPLEDRLSLQQWLEAQRKADLQLADETAPYSVEFASQSSLANHHDAQAEQRAERLRQELDEYHRAKQWIAAHRAEYLGQWVVLEGDRLISHGTDSSQVYDQAKAAGIKIPFLVRIVEEPAAFMTGLL